MMRKAKELPPPYKIPIEAFDVEIDHTPRPPLFRNDDSSNSLSEMGRENKDVIYVGVFDPIPNRFHVLAPLHNYGHPKIADYDPLYPGSTTPIGIKKVEPRCSSSETSSDTSDTSSGEDMLKRRRRIRAASLGNYPETKSKAKQEKMERRIALDTYMEWKKCENFGKADERARELARHRRMEKEKEAERAARKEEKKKSKKEKESVSLDEEAVPRQQLRRPVPPSEQKEQKKEKKKEKRDKDRENK